MTLLLPLFQIALFSVLAFAAGSLLWLPREPRTLAHGVMDGVVAASAGLALFSAAAVWLGLAGVLWWWTFWPVAVALGLGGTARWVRAARPGRALDAGPAVGGGGLPADRPGRVATGVACLVAGLLALVTVSGAMTPDLSQDAVWYHISLPVQWVVRGDVAMFPHVMPSTYWLAGDMLYAPLLMVGDDLLCSGLAGAVRLGLYGAFAAAGFLVGGRWGLLYAVAVTCPLWAVNLGRAPIPADNDALTTLWVLAGAWIILAPHVAGGRRGRIDWPLAGFLFGTAVASKLVALGFVLAWLAGMGVARLVHSRRLSRATVAAVALAAGCAVLAVSPWGLRGVAECGNPQPVVLRGVLPLPPEFAPADAGYEHEPSRLYAPTWDGLREAATTGLPLKLTHALSSREVLVFLLLVGAAACATRRDWIWRGQALGLLGCYAGLFFLQGYNEVIRYFSIAFAFAPWPVAFLFRQVTGALPARRASALFLVLALAATYTWSTQQWRWAGMHTYQWNFLPVTTAEQRREWALVRESGSVYLAGRLLNERLPAGAMVVLPDMPGSLVLRRRAVWSDYASTSIPDSLWAGLDSNGLLRQLRAAGTTHVFYVVAGNADARILELEASGALRRVEAATAEGPVGLWQVVGGA